MKSFLRLTDYTVDEVKEIFEIADQISDGKYANYFNGKSIVLFSTIPAKYYRICMHYQRFDEISKKTSFCFVEKREISVLHGKKRQRSCILIYLNVVVRGMKWKGLQHTII